MRNAKICAIIYYIAAFFGFINAFTAFGQEKSSGGIFWAFVTIGLLVAGTYYLLKSRNQS